MTMYDYVEYVLYDYVWLYMTLHGTVVLCINLYDNIWLCIIIYDCVLLLWQRITKYDFVWLIMTVPFCQSVWLCMIMYDYVWQCMKQYETRLGLKCQTPVKVKPLSKENFHSKI